MEPKMFVAMKGFVVHNGRILILREASSYKEGSNRGRYDIVGGRIKPGEHFSESLLREIKEETGLTVKIGRPFFVNEWRPQVKGEAWHVVATFLECEAVQQNVVLSDDHDHFLWIDPREFRNYNLIPNLHPAFEEYLRKDDQK
ncbi:NUDIX domain-containing protein [Candidatus Woesearchaeota archaeon]|nr:NUDIX domain-containing protein [Candidatus Woesearchaeota archaeon]